MRYTITFLESDLDCLTAHLRHSDDEEAAYLIARIVETKDETRLLVREVIPVVPDDIESQSANQMSIRSRSYVSAFKRAKLDGSACVFVHSHPTGQDGFSDQDDLEEPALFKSAHERAPQPVHASLVVSNQTTRFIGRVWRSDGTTAPIDMIRVIGRRWRFLSREAVYAEIPECFDRQVRAFGSEIQKLLGHLHVGIVGAGGTGSAVVEQLIRLGVGRLTVIDHDGFSVSNVNRVYGSGVADADVPKVIIAARNAERIGLGTTLIPINGHLGKKSVAAKLRECDLVFGCTDDQWGRSILSRLSIYYAIPVIDVGVSIDPAGESIRSIHGRVTLLQPGYACLFCRERVDAEGVRAESISMTDPIRAKALAAEGYITGVHAPAPAVISFTTSIASAGVAELLDRLIGYRTAEVKSSEYIHRFEAETVSPNTRPSRPECFCADPKLECAGDRKLFLGITWMQEP